MLGVSLEAGSLTTVPRELAKCKLDLVEAQEMGQRWHWINMGLYVFLQKWE
jgi:hypothetical protein